MTTPNPKSALKRAVDLAGGPSALADGLRAYKALSKISQSNIWNWLHRDKRLPAEACRPIEAVMNGAVKAWELRPDLFDPPGGGA